MIVILCDSWQDAMDAYNCFLDFLEQNEPDHIDHCDSYGYYIQTDDDIRYIFTDYRWESTFEKIMGVEFVNSDQFFDGIYDFYFRQYQEEPCEWKNYIQDYCY